MALEPAEEHCGGGGGAHQSSRSSRPLHMSYSVHKHDLFHSHYMPGPLAAGTPIPTVAAA